MPDGPPGSKMAAKPESKPKPLCVYIYITAGKDKATAKSREREREGRKELVASPQRWQCWQESSEAGRVG